VELNMGENQVVMRSSVTPDLGQITFTAPQWRSFVAAIKAGEFDS
jgi:hypothetical protein